MIKNDIIKKMDDCNINDFRYMMYLARNQAWVSIGDEIYHLIITDVVKTIERKEGSVTYYDHKNIHVNSDDDNGLKLLLSKDATDILVSDVSSSLKNVNGTGHDKLHDLNLNLISKNFDRLCVGLSDGSIALVVSVENFDSYFSNEYLNNDKNFEQHELKDYISLFDIFKKGAQ